MGLRGSASPRPIGVIDSSDSSAPSAIAPSPDLLHMALTSYLPDEVGWCGAARLDSSSRHNSPDAINCLRRPSVDGTLPEAAPSTSKEAPQWSQALRQLPKQSSPTPRQTGARVVHPLKSNQLPGVRLGVTEQRAQQGPPIQGLTCSHFPNLWPQWVGPRRPAQQDRGLLLKPLEGRGASEIKQP
jgi:hypothetical protein